MTSGVQGALEIAVVPLDVVRGSFLRLATRSAAVTRVLARRDSRLALLATLQVAVLFALVVRAPVALFFLGPVVLGVVHLAADARYLVLHRAPPRLLVVLSAAIALAITLVRVAVARHVLRIATGDAVDVALGVAWVGVALGFALRTRSRIAPLPVLVGGTLLFVASGTWLVLHAHLVGLVLVHAHNVVAVLVWLVLFRRQRAWAVVPVTLIVGLTAVLLSGAYLPWTATHGGLAAFGARAESLGTWLAPGLSPQAGLAVVMTFVFLQGVHYAAWTGWIAQDDLRGEGTPTFRQTVRSLVADFGPRTFALIAVAACALAAFALHDMRAALSWYMTLAKSHAWFELAFFAYLLSRRTESA